jgi:hypothetical protein
MWSLSSIWLAVRGRCVRPAPVSVSVRESVHQARKYCTLMSRQETPGSKRRTAPSPRGGAQRSDGPPPDGKAARIMMGPRGWDSGSSRLLLQSGPVATRSGALSTTRPGAGPARAVRACPLRLIIPLASQAVLPLPRRCLRVRSIPRHVRRPRGPAGRRHANPAPPGSNLATRPSEPPKTARDLPQGTEPPARR